MARNTPTRWNEDMGEERLWVCQSCDAHLDADCVGNECPVCGEPTTDDEQT